MTETARTQLLTPEEAAERLSTTKRFIRRLVEERKITFIKVGRFIRFTDADLDTYIAERKVSPGEWYVPR